MATDWVVGIGGTGGKILEVLVNLLSLGVGQGLLDGTEPRDLKLFLLDQDQNPWAQELQPKLQAYEKLRRAIKSQGDGPQPLRRVVSFQRPFPFRPLGDEAGGKTLAFDLLPGKHNEAKAFLPWEDVLDKDIQAGFYGKPALGASVLAWLSSRPEFKGAFLEPLLRDLTNAAGQGDQVRVFLVGSGFGGTGSAGLRTMAALLRDIAQKEGAATPELLTIHGIILGPYFAPAGAGAPSWLGTASNRIRCSQVLSDLALTQPFDSLLLLGEPQPVAIPSNHVSGAGQLDNPYHPVEVLAACHLLDIDESRTTLDFDQGRFSYQSSLKEENDPPNGRGSLNNSGPRNISYFVRPSKNAEWGHFPGGKYRKAELEATLAHGLLMAREVENPTTPVPEYLSFLQSAWEWFYKRFVETEWHPSSWESGMAQAPGYHFWDRPTGCNWPESQERIFSPAIRLKQFRIAEKFLPAATGYRDWGSEDTGSVFSKWWERVGPGIGKGIESSAETNADLSQVRVLPFPSDAMDNIATTPGIHNHSSLTAIIKQLGEGLPPGAAGNSERLSYFPTFWAAAQYQRIKIRDHRPRPQGDFDGLDADMKEWLGLAYGVFMGVFSPVALGDQGDLGQILDKTSPIQGAAPYYLLAAKLPSGGSIFVGGHDPRGGVWIIPEASRKDCGWPTNPVDLGQGISLGPNLTWAPPGSNALPSAFRTYLDGFAPIDTKITNLRDNLNAEMPNGVLVQNWPNHERYNSLKKFSYEAGGQPPPPIPNGPNQPRQIPVPPIPIRPIPDFDISE